MLKVNKLYKIAKAIEVTLYSLVGAIAAAGIITSSALAHKRADAYNSLAEETQYNEYVAEESAAAEDQLAAGVISDKQYNQKIEEINNFDAYIKNQGTPQQLAEYDKVLKYSNGILITIGVTTTSAIGTVIALDAAYNKFTKKAQEMSNEDLGEFFDNNREEDICQ